jgi:hypothetical protein
VSHPLALSAANVFSGRTNGAPGKSSGVHFKEFGTCLGDRRALVRLSNLSGLSEVRDDAEPIRVPLRVGGIYEVGLSFVTRSANQLSSSDRWSFVISVKARPIPNRTSE